MAVYGFEVHSVLQNAIDPCGIIFIPAIRFGFKVALGNFNKRNAVFEIITLALDYSGGTVGPSFPDRSDSLVVVFNKIWKAIAGFLHYNYFEADSNAVEEYGEF